MCLFTPVKRVFHLFWADSCGLYNSHSEHWRWGFHCHLYLTVYVVKVLNLWTLNKELLRALMLRVSPLFHFHALFQHVLLGRFVCKQQLYLSRVNNNKNKNLSFLSFCHSLNTASYSLWTVVSILCFMWCLVEVKLNCINY